MLTATLSIAMEMVMKKEPTIEVRPEQAYVGLRAVMPMSDFPREIPKMSDRISEWLESSGQRPSGKPFLRYLVIDMPEHMDVEVGIPTEQHVEAAGPVQQNTLPAGRYATTTYVGVKNGVAANKDLIEWIGRQAEATASNSTEQGEVFEARFETVLTDAKAEPDQDKWVTDVAIKLRD